MTLVSISVNGVASQIGGVEGQMSEIVICGCSGDIAGVVRNVQWLAHLSRASSHMQ